MSTPELNEPLLKGLYEAVSSNAAITTLLGTFNSEPSIHTKRPVPAAAGYPMVLIGPMLARGDADEIDTARPIPVIDVSVVGNQDGDYRAVEKVASLIFQMFHRTRTLTVSGYSLIQSRASGPSPMPSDDSKVGRRVPLTIELRAIT